MPVYQYRDTRAGGVVELVRPVADRDRVGAHLERITVPARVAIHGTSSSPIDPDTADAEVPKAFRDLERTMPARQIVKESGFSVDQIKRAWAMACLALLAVSTAQAADITKGYTFTAGEQNVTHTKLNNLVDAATISTAFVTGKSADPAPATTDLLLSYSVSADLYKKITLANAFFDHLSLITNRTEASETETNDLVLIYDVSAGGHRKVSLHTLALGSTNYTFNATPAGGDSLLVFDTAAGTLKRVYFTNLLYGWSTNLAGSLGLSNLTAHTTLTNLDLVWIYDSQANSNKQVALTNLLVGGYPTKASPTTNDLLAIYDAATDSVAKTTLAAVKTLMAATTVAFTNAVPGAGLAVTNAHGFAVAPTLVRCTLLCTNAEIGYAIGDEIEIWQAQNATANQRTFSVIADGTNVIVLENSTATTYLMNKSDGTIAGDAPHQMTPGNWNIVTRAVHHP